MQFVYNPDSVGMIYSILALSRQISSTLKQCLTSVEHQNFTFASELNNNPDRETSSRSN